MSQAQSTYDDPDTVGITVGRYSLYGWQDVRITRSIEQFPSSFTLRLTERFPTQAGAILIQPGDPIKVTIGGDTVLTGYVDDYAASYTATAHEVELTGRSKCMDLIDCSAGESPYQLNNTTLVNLAGQLAEPYGITTSAPDGDSGVIPQVNVTLTESAMEVLDPIAAWANFILHDDTNGNLVVSKVGTSSAASGFVEGQNVQAASLHLSMQNRFSEIEAIFLSTGFLVDGPPEPGDDNAPLIPFVPGAQARDDSIPKRADGEPRFRRLLIVSEQAQNLPALAAQRAKWEMARRIGRSQQVRITCDNWRDEAGALWTPNTLAPISLGQLKLVNAVWLIVTVSFVKNENGTTAELVLMPKEAFIPQPLNLAPFDAQIAKDLPGGMTSTLAPAPR